MLDLSCVIPTVGILCFCSRLGNVLEEAAK